MYPPTPWTGSAIRQATSPLVVVASSSRRSATEASTNSSSVRPASRPRIRSPECRKLTRSPDSGDADQLRTPVAPSTANVRPW